MVKKIVIALLLLCQCTVFANTQATHPHKKTPPAFTSNKAPITVRQGHTFHIILQSNPTTGFSWKWKPTKEDQRLVSLVSQKYVASTDKKLVGAPGYEIWVFRANTSKTNPYRVTQVGHIVMDYERPWEKNNAMRKTFIVHVK